MANENGQEKRETLADIVAAMHNDAELYHDAWLNDPNENPEADDVSKILAHYAMRIEAAWKLELAEFERKCTEAVTIAATQGVLLTKEKYEKSPVGNAAAMREALENSNGLLEELAAIGEWGESARGQIAENNAALSAPARQCDVGTAAEQAERFHAFCDGHSSGIGGMCDGNCPCFGGVDGCHCLCKWAQTPYAEEGGAE